MVINSCTPPPNSGGPGILPLCTMNQHMSSLGSPLESASFSSPLYESELSSPPLSADSRQLVDLDRQHVDVNVQHEGLTVLQEQTGVTEHVLSHDHHHHHHQQLQQLSMHQQNVRINVHHQQEFHGMPHLSHHSEQTMSAVSDFPGMMPSSVPLPGVDELGEGLRDLHQLPNSSSPHGSLYSPLDQYRQQHQQQYIQHHGSPVNMRSMAYPPYTPLNQLHHPPNVSLHCFDSGFPHEAAFDTQTSAQNSCFPYLPQSLTSGPSGGGFQVGGRNCGRGLEPAKKKERVRRPMNSFMVWSKNERKKLAKELPACNNSDLSRELASTW